MPAAITIRSRSGASRTTTASRRSSPRSGARRGRARAKSGSSTAAASRRPESQDRPRREADRPRCQAVEISADDDPRQALADWMAAKDNPFFAPLARQSLLEALLRPRPGRSGRRHAGDQPGVEPGAAGRRWPRTSSTQFRPEEPGPHDLQLQVYQLSAGPTSATRTTSRTSPATIPSG